MFYFTPSVAVTLISIGSCIILFEIFKFWFTKKFLRSKALNNIFINFNQVQSMKIVVALNQ